MRKSQTGVDKHLRYRWRVPGLSTKLRVDTETSVKQSQDNNYPSQMNTHLLYNYYTLSYRHEKRDTESIKMSGKEALLLPGAPVWQSDICGNNC